MSPRESKNRSKRFRNLYKYPKRSRFWVYRRFSPERSEEFSFSTGEESNEKLAHAIGEKEYHKWLMLEPEARAADGQVFYFKDFAQAHLDRKLARPDADFSKNSKNTSKNATRHLIEAFGALPLDRITEDRWEDYCNRLAEAGSPPKFFNRLKELKEILRRAHRNGLIKRLPEFRNPDAASDTGRYLEDWEVKLLLEAAAESESANFDLFLELLWRQGPRPREEALKYEWDMIDWRAGEHGALSVPGRITKTRRSRTIPLHSEISAKLRRLQKAATSRFIFPSPARQKGPDFPMADYRAAWEGTLARAQEKAKKTGRKLAHCVVYDFRRTFITNCAKRGKDILWVAKYTDTSVKMIERFYAKVQHDALQGVIE